MNFHRIGDEIFGYVIADQVQVRMCLYSLFSYNKLLSVLLSLYSTAKPSWQFH